MMILTGRRIAAMATALALAAALTACSGAAEPAAKTTAAATSNAEGTEGVEEASDHNDADTEFAQMMIVHHRGAMEMADLAVTNAESADVRALAERISAAQGPEIDEMTSWLQAWGEEGPGEASMGGMDHGGMEVGGMDTEAAMAELRGLSGAEFDRRFLEMMIEHHRGAIEMAEAHPDDGSSTEARALARTIIDDQTREITEMENLLSDL